MQPVHYIKSRGLSICAVLALSAFLSACGGGGGGSDSDPGAASDSPAAPNTAVQDNAASQDAIRDTDSPAQTGSEDDSPTVPIVIPGTGNTIGNQAPYGPNTPEQPGEPLPEQDPVDETPAPAAAPPPAGEAARFLSQATFGPTGTAIDELQALGYENWLLAEFEKPATLHLDKVLSAFPASGEFLDSEGQLLPGLENLASNSFWQTSIEADDQLRQRMAYALSQILVFSDQTMFRKAPQMKARYMDILTRGAFGNYRDLLEQVTYSTAMGNYLTYIRSRKGDPATGSQPDENYARELLQLFTVGLVELNPDGTPKVDNLGREIPVYDNADIRELAKVFTGLGYRNAGFYEPFESIPPTSVYSPMVMFEEHNDKASKSVFDTIIPAGIDGRQGIGMALDAIFAHANVGPFISRQLIQRFITSNPSPAYTRRVAAAFDRGSYALPSGGTVGSGRRGDLQATLAAIMLDEEARGPAARERDTFGKLREPVLRFTHWARAFNVDDPDPSNVNLLQASGADVRLGQHPFRAPSVFNFYRPGYTAPGSSTAAAGLNAPELEITNATSIVGYSAFIAAFIFETFDPLDPSRQRSFKPDYSLHANLAADVDALLDSLDLVLTHGTLREETRNRIAAMLATKAAVTPEERRYRTQLATMMIMTSPEYIVLR